MQSLGYTDKILSVLFLKIRNTKANSMKTCEAGNKGLSRYSLLVNIKVRLLTLLCRLPLYFSILLLLK